MWLLSIPLPRSSHWSPVFRSGLVAALVDFPFEFQLSYPQGPGSLGFLSLPVSLKTTLLARTPARPLALVLWSCLPPSLPSSLPSPPLGIFLQGERDPQRPPAPGVPRPAGATCLPWWQACGVWGFSGCSAVLPVAAPPPLSGLLEDY